MEDAGAACPGHALVTVTDAAGEPQGGCGSAPRQPSEAVRGKGTQLTQGPGGERRKPGAQGLFLGGRMLPVDPRGCSSGRVSWSSKARRAGLTPCCVACSHESTLSGPCILHLQHRGRVGEEHPTLPSGLAPGQRAKSGLSAEAGMGGTEPLSVPPCLGVPRRQRDSVQALRILCWTAWAHICRGDLGSGWKRSLELGWQQENDLPGRLIWGQASWAGPEVWQQGPGMKVAGAWVP